LAKITTKKVAIKNWPKRRKKQNRQPTNGGAKKMKLNENTKLNRTLLAVLAGAQFAFTAFADDGAATNSVTAAPVEVPAYSADAATANPAEAAEITALKKEVQALEQKVSALEQQHAPEQPSAQVQDLDQKVRILERQRELDQEAAASAAKAQPRLTVGANGATFSSADTNFSISLHGWVQVDSRTFGNDDHVQGNDSILLRRARPSLSGTLYRDFDFLFAPEFGNATPGAASAATTPSIYDAYMNYHYSPAFQVQAGRFKPPVGLEYLQQDIYSSFNERSLATDLIPGRDLGFELHGDVFGGVLSYAAGIFNGVGDNQRNTTDTSFQDDREFDGRLFVQPFKTSGIAALQNLGVGVGGSWGRSSITNTLDLPNTTGGTLPGFSTDGQQQFFAYNPATGGVVANGTHWRFSPQGYYYYGPFGLLGEYVISDQGVENTVSLATADLKNTAWEISGGWVLTGEDASYTGVTPRHPFDPGNGGWGAWQLVARYAELNVDSAAFPVFSNPATSASAAQAWSLGLNWYLNRNIRVNASYSRTTFTGGGTTTATTAPNAVSSHPEDVFFTRVQLAF
jgi:phosphate-selective porin OprO/OprP